MTDRDGKIVWRDRYSAWGRLAYEEGVITQNLLMQGQYHGHETDLCYNTFRYYDGDIGRFTSEDPIGLGGGHNFYQYAPNPLAWIDPWGWCPKSKSSSPRRTKHTSNRHESRKKYPSKSKYKKPSERVKLENRTIKNPDRVIPQKNGRVRYEKDYGRVIGTRGETSHRVIVDTNKNKIVTSFPQQKPTT